MQELQPLQAPVLRLRLHLLNNNFNLCNNSNNHNNSIHNNSSNSTSNNNN
ncbi:hypothetical protein CLOM_g15513, partial [Closterium sp. NIES-68]